MIFFVLLNAYFDACLASFALLAAVRTLEEKKWWGNARSACPKCGHFLSATELFPIFSYLLLKGRCKHCNEKIAQEHFIAEVAGALCGALFAVRFGQNLFALALCHTAFVFLLFSTVTDIKTGYVYDNWAYAMAVTALAIRLLFGGFTAFADGIYGLAAGFSLFFAIYLCSRKKGMGLGDACIMLGIGAVLGLKLTIFALYSTFFIGALYAIPMLVSKKATRKTALPLVPFLAAGTLIALLFGNIALTYLGFGEVWPL